MRDHIVGAGEKFDLNIGRFGPAHQINVGSDLVSVGGSGFNLLRGERGTERREGERGRERNREEGVRRREEGKEGS